MSGTRAKNGEKCNGIDAKFNALMSKRTPRFDTHYKFANSQSLAYDRIGRPYVDRSKVCATATISTATIDREGDLLIPMGFNLEKYRKNPVVMWGHGFEGITHPIGVSQSPETGELSVVITEDEVKATCYFAQSSKDAMQIFELVDEGIVRATSVRETPIRARVVWIDGQEVLVVDECELEEWSWAAMGINPDAVAKAISKNRLGGSQIVPSIMKSLLAIAPTLKKKGIGFTKVKSMAGTDNDNDNDLDDLNTPADEAPGGEGVGDGTVDATVDSPDTSESDSDQTLDDQTKADTATNVSNETDYSDDYAKLPYGKQILDNTHGALKDCVKVLNGCLDQRLEHQGVKDTMSGVRDSLMDQVKAIEGASALHYPDMKCNLKSDDMGDAAATTGDLDTEMKSFLAHFKGAPLQMLSLQTSLKGMLSAKNLTAEQRKTLRSVVSHQDRLMSQAKSLRIKNEQAAKAKAVQSAAVPTAEQQKELDALLASYKSRS